MSCIRAERIIHPIRAYEYNLIATKDMDPDLHEVEKGVVMWKMRSFRKWFRRTYRVDLKRLLLQYEPSNKPFWACTDNTIDLHDVIEIREGWKTDAWNQLAAKLSKANANYTGNVPLRVDERLCFSIIYKGTEGDRRSLDLAAPNENVRKVWVRAFHLLLEKIQNLRSEDVYNRWLKQQFEGADVDNSGFLDFNEVLKLLNQLNISIDKKKAAMLFEEANVDKSAYGGEQVLDRDEFVYFYKMFTQRPELVKLFEQYSTSGAINVEGLTEFLQNEQCQTDATEDDADVLIETYEPSDLKNNKLMTQDGFRKMLLGKYSIFNVEHQTIYQDMTQPLNQYFIASSHNTYLTSHQLYGESSVENYISVLLSGCRCIELDCWDGPDGEPIVYHGYTATSKIKFVDIIQDAVNVYAFKTSPFPLILSLEVHCNREQQQRMSTYLTNILGHKLYTKDIDPDMDALPSPESLRGKILVKAKKHSPVEGESDSEEDDEKIVLEAMKASKSIRKYSRKTSVKKRLDDQYENVVPKPKPVIEKAAEELYKKVSMNRQLSDIVNLVQAVHFKGFEAALSSGKCYQMSSLKESKALALIEAQNQKFKEYTRNHLARIYPDGQRTDSSNFNPIDFWNVGCQLVALNYQTPDKEMMINRAQFKQNGKCGYVLKPPYLRNENSHPTKRCLSIKIVSGQYLPKPNKSQESDILDPYVVVRVYGHPDDTTKRKTKSVHDNGFNPIWDEEFIINVRYPELAILSFLVKDYSKTGKNRIVAAYALPFCSIQNGYCHILLEDELGCPVSPASLFVKTVVN